MMSRGFAYTLARPSLALSTAHPSALAIGGAYNLSRFAKKSSDTSFPIGRTSSTSNPAWSSASVIVFRSK